MLRLSYTCLLLCALFFSLAACGGGNGHASAPNDPATQAEEPGKNDASENVAEDITPEELARGHGRAFDDDDRKMKYKQMLSGKWINQAAPDVTIEFTGDHFQRSKGGNLTEHSAYTLYLDCNTESCKKGSDNAPIGWCFTTESGCYLVTSANAFKLQVTNVSTNEIVFYEKSAN